MSLIWFIYGGIHVGIVPYYVLVAIFFSLLVYIFSYLLMKRHVFSLEKYNSSPIDKTAAQQILLRVKDLFEKESVYLDSDLSLKDIAKRVGVNARDVSQGY